MFSQKLAHVSRSSIWKNLVCPFFIFKAIFVVGYYNEFTVERRKIVSKLFVKDDLKKLQEMNPMGLSVPWEDYLEIIVLHPVNNIVRG